MEETRVFEGPVHSTFTIRDEDGTKMEGRPVMNTSAGDVLVFDLFAAQGFRVDEQYSHRRLYGSFRVKVTALANDSSSEYEGLLVRDVWGPADVSDGLVTILTLESGGSAESNQPLPRLFGYGEKSDSGRCDYGSFRLEITTLTRESERPLGDEAAHEAELEAEALEEEMAYRHQIAAQIISGEIPLEAIGFGG